MKSADLRPGTTENPREKEDRCAGWRPRIIESAAEFRDSILDFSESGMVAPELARNSRL